MDTVRELGLIGEQIGERGGEWEAARLECAQVARAYADRLGPKSERERTLLILAYGRTLLVNAHYYHPDQPESDDWWDD
jgi:hypothetical protein